MTFDEYYCGRDFHERTKELAIDTFEEKNALGKTTIEGLSWFNFPAFGTSMQSASRAVVTFTRALASVA